MENKPTHILIRINLIESIISDFSQKLKDTRYNDESWYHQAQIESEKWEELLQNSKQIALDDESIEAKAEIYCQRDIKAGYESRKQGFKVALKDLKKE